jgi:PTH1 family peptidyl-tRNA hydrolase
MNNKPITSLAIVPKVIIGLGNPGPTYYYQRHNIGFRIVDALADQYNGVWHTKGNAHIAQITINNYPITLIKPQTFMNASGECLSPIVKQGTKSEEIMVVHDELELPFGKLKLRITGSAKGHNGLKSIIKYCGQNFSRLGFGIDRPQRQEDVPDYVLSKFSPQENVDDALKNAVTLIENIFNT